MVVNEASPSLKKTWNVRCGACTATKYYIQFSIGLYAAVRLLLLETCTLDFSTEYNSLKSALFALRVFLYDSRMNVPWRSQDDRPGEHVLELLEEKLFSNTSDS